MKHSIFTILLIVSLNIATAQSPLMATLDHAGEITHFYNSNALASAVSVAEDGDIITLSSGTFNGATISKAITLRGAGMDNVYGESTYIKSEISITDTIQELQIEDLSALYITQNGKVFNLKFERCHIKNGLNAKKNTNIETLLCKSCRIGDISANATIQTTQILNSVVCFISNISNVQVYNSIIDPSSTFTNSVIWNSIITSSNVSNTISAFNCIGWNGSNSNIFSTCSGSNNTLINWTTSIFKDNTITPAKLTDDFLSYELSDDIKSTYSGNDGTEVGIYGGVYPYTSKPTTPKIIKCNVANKSTADGKLSVDIEVSAQE